MTNLRTGELEVLQAQFPRVTLTEVADGSSLLTIHDVSLPSGWSPSVTDISFLVPAAYPAAQPDCFWASADLRLVSGEPPSNSGAQVVPVTEAPGLWFSWHLPNWRPSVDTITTYARFVLSRFLDAR
jgi:hypothetical protein